MLVASKLLFNLTNRNKGTYLPFFSNWFHRRSPFNTFYTAAHCLVAPAYHPLNPLPIFHLTIQTIIFPRYFQTAKLASETFIHKFNIPQCRRTTGFESKISLITMEEEVPQDHLRHHQPQGQVRNIKKYVANIRAARGVSFLMNRELLTRKDHMLHLRHSSVSTASPLSLPHPTLTNMWV